MLGGCGDRPENTRGSPRPTIVSLNLCADEILAEVATRDQLLAVSRYSHDPRVSSVPAAAMRRFPATSGAVEEIAALAPDVVVGDSFTPPATRSALARIGIGFVALPIASDVAASKAQVRMLARLAGDAPRGEALVRRIERSLTAWAASPGLPVRTALVWQGGGLVAGDDSLVSELLIHAGFAPAAAARGLRQGSLVSLEAMLAAPPQVLLVAGDPRANEDRLLRHPALDRLASVTRARFDSKLFYCGGPSIPRAMRRLQAIRMSLAGRSP